MIWRADPQVLWIALSDSFSSSFESSFSVYLIGSFDLAWNSVFLSILWPGNQEKREFLSSSQALWRQSAFQRRSQRGYLRWMSNWQCSTCAEPVWPCATGVLCFLLPCFHPCFCSLLSVNVLIWNHLSLPLFRLGCIKKLYLFFVYFLHHLQFPITKVN